MASLWRIDRAKLPPKPAKTRKIRGGPLIELPALQQAIADDVLRDDGVWLATRKAERDVENLEWNYRDVLDCIVKLLPDDFKYSEWCDDSYRGMHPCDAYAIPYDDRTRKRTRNSCCYYLKFSLDEEGGLVLVVISCHL